MIISVRETRSVREWIIEDPGKVEMPIIGKKTDGTLILEGFDRYQKLSKVGDTLEEHLQRDPNAWMLINISGTHHIKQISQVLSN